MKGNTINVWPNPVATTVTIHCNDAGNAGMEGNVVNQTGSLIMQFSLSATGTTLDASTWPAGIYFIRLADGNVFKIEKQ
jgi:hypothetical protein